MHTLCARAGIVASGAAAEDEQAGWVRGCEPHALFYVVQEPLQLPTLIVYEVPVLFRVCGGTRHITAHEHSVTCHDDEMRSVAPWTMGGARAPCYVCGRQALVALGGSGLDTVGPLRVGPIG